MRAEVTQARRVVVKIGSSSLTKGGGIDPDRIVQLVDTLAEVRKRGLDPGNP